jgi:outer membrane receptor protein involved in Fe transport
LTKQQRTDRDYAAFGELSFDVTDKLTLTGGARLYKYDNSLEGFFGYASSVGSCIRPDAISGAPCTRFDKTTKATDFIHKVNATYKINDDALVYATWSRGFRPGGINRRGTLPPYGSDRLDNYELGWKTNFGPFRFNGALYQLDWNNIQLSFLGLNGLTEIRNAGIARIRGAEIDMGYRAGGFSLNAGLSYNDAEIRKDFCRIANPTFDCTTAGNSLLAPAGSRLPVTPKFKGNVVARYEFPVGEWNGHFQFAANHTGSRTTDLRTVQSALKGSLGSYTTVDLSFGMKNDDWSVELFATNLFDEFGVVSTGVSCNESVCGTGVTPTTPTGGAFYDTIIKPRVIGLKFSRDF